MVLGDWSYAWYLWHWPMIVLAETLWPEHGWLPPVVALASLAPAALSTVLVERPHRVRPSGRIPIGTPVIALVATALLISGGVWFGARAGWGVDVPGDWYDIPPGRSAGCTLLNRDIENTWPEDLCRTPGQPGRLVLVLGDELADSVTPGVVEAVSDLGYGTAVWARAGCPFSGRTPVDYPQCNRWNRDALQLVDRLRPRVVVIANNGVGYVSPTRRHPSPAETATAPTAPSPRSHPGASDSPRRWTSWNNGTSPSW